MIAIGMKAVTIAMWWMTVQISRGKWGVLSDWVCMKKCLTY